MFSNRPCIQGNKPARYSSLSLCVVLLSSHPSLEFLFHVLLWIPLHVLLWSRHGSHCGLKQVGNKLSCLKSSVGLWQLNPHSSCHEKVVLACVHIEHYHLTPSYFLHCSLFVVVLVPLISFTSIVLPYPTTLMSVNPVLGDCTCLQSFFSFSYNQHLLQMM